MKDTSKTLENMYNRLDKFLRTETVVGETIEVGEIKLIPVISASFGMGGGMSESSAPKGEESEGGGGGVGCKISPQAILVVRGEEVELVSLEDRGSLDRLLEKVPELIERLAQAKGDICCEDEDSADEPSSDEKEGEEDVTGEY